MLSKWKIKNIHNYVFGEDKKLYKLSFESNNKHYEVREIKKQYPNRYRINGQWWSERQLKPKLILDTNPIELFKDGELPF
jgi:hypothetical protein